MTKSVQTRVAALTLMVAIGMLAAMLLTTGGQFAFPLDDPYIYFQYASQNARGELFRYNDGDPTTTGATSVLYLMLLTPFALVFKGTSLGIVAFVGAVVLLFFTLRSVHRIAAVWIAPSAAWPTTFLVALGGPFLWGMFSGMESAVVAFLGVRLAEEFLRLGGIRFDGTPGDGASGSRKRFIIFAVLFALSRPEAALLVLLLVLGRLVVDRGTGGLGVGGVVIPLAAVALPFVLNLILTGESGTMTFRSKGAVYLPGTTFGTWLMKTTLFAFHNLKGIFDSGEAGYPSWPRAAGTLTAFAAPLTLFFAVLGALPAAYDEWRRKRAGFAWAAGLLVAGTLIFWAAAVPSNLHWNRYLQPSLPFITLFVVAGAYRLSGAFRGEEAGVAVRRGIIGFFLICAAGASLHFASVYGWNCREIFNQHITMARWIAVNTPSGAIIGTNDVGALRYYGGRYVLDVHGLTSRDLAACKQVGSAGIYEYLEGMPDMKRPNYLVLIRGWYEPEFFNMHRPLRSQSLRLATIAGSPLDLFAANWSGAKAGHVPGPATLQDLGGLRLVDRVDVADLRSEAQHEYRLRLLPGESAGPIRFLPPPGADYPIADGGRLVTDSEEMTLSGLTPGRPAVLVMRGVGNISAMVRFDDAQAVPLRARATGDGSQWTEAILRIPGSHLRGSSARLVVTASDGAYKEGGYGAFHYWIYQ